MPELPPFDAFPVLSGAEVHLREMSEVDLPAWFERACDAESAVLSGDPVPDSIEVVAGWLDVHRTRYRSGEGIRWAIVPADAATSVGSIGLSNLHADARTAELGAVIDRTHRGRGLGTAAARLVCAFAFETMGLDAVVADCLARNTASVRVLDRLGFSKIEDIHDYAPGEMGMRFRLHRVRTFDRA